MKRYYKLTTLLFAILLVFNACRKEEKLDVDFSSYNQDNPETNTALDQWLKANFLDEYNIGVEYRYNRYYGSNAANLVPPKLENVQPTMQMVLDGFISPYRKVAGATFTKTYMPKEWILYGSNSYNSTSDPGQAGTATAGRRITLYGLNQYQPVNTIAGRDYAWDRQRIMHHELTHILNQIIAIPPDFEPISRGFYRQPYTDTPTDTARRNGFVTSYASGVYTEDYAETVGYLLINGQVWYNDYANFANTAGKARFTQKQANVTKYFSNLGIDFKALQMEVQQYMKSIGRDQTKFAYWLNKARTPLVTPAPTPAPAPLPTFKTMTINPASDYSVKYGSSAPFTAMYNTMNAAVNAQNAAYSVNFIRINFVTPTSMYLELNVATTASSTPFLAYYPFNLTTNVATGEVKFTTGTAGGTNNAWVNNANYFRPSIQPVLNYLLNNTFIADFLPVNVQPVDYMSSAGFTVKGTPDNYFYGPLTY